MTALTPYYGFVYPIGTDRPQDATLTWAQMVTQVEGLIEFLDNEYQRFAKVPLAIVEATKTQTLSTFDNIAFDRVAEDTWGMTDLAVSPYTITIPASVPGTYMVGGLALMGGLSAANGLNTSAGLFTDTPWGHENYVTVPGAVSTDGGIGVQAWSIERVSASADRTLKLCTSQTGTVTYARFWAFWLSDY